MIGHNSTISEHQTIRRNVFDFLVDLLMGLAEKSISVVDLIDYVNELKTCRQSHLHQASIKCLDSIIVRLTEGPPPDKMEIDDLMRSWLSAKADLEYCRESLIHY